MHVYLHADGDHSKSRSLGFSRYNKKASEIPFLAGGVPMTRTTRLRLFDPPPP